VHAIATKGKEIIVGGNFATAGGITVNNINGFGSVSGARDPRILQMMVRMQF